MPNAVDQNTAAFVNFPDDYVGRHFGHLGGEYAKRHPGSVWRFPIVVARIPDLYCWHPDPGCAKDPRGLMGSVGMEPTGYRDVLISELAGHLHQGLSSGTADRQNRALADIIAFLKEGPDYTKSRAQPITLLNDSGKLYVFDGTRRAIALSMMGVATLQSFDISKFEWRSRLGTIPYHR